MQRLPRRVLKHLVGHTIDLDIVNSAFVIVCLPQAYCHHNLLGVTDRVDPTPRDSDDGSAGLPWQTEMHRHMYLLGIVGKPSAFQQLSRTSSAEHSENECDNQTVEVVHVISRSFRRCRILASAGLTTSQGTR